MNLEISKNQLNTLGWIRIIAASLSILALTGSKLTALESIQGLTVPIFRDGNAYPSIVLKCGWAGKEFGNLGSYQIALMPRLTLRNVAILISDTESAASAFRSIPEALSNISHRHSLHLDGLFIESRGTNKFSLTAHAADWPQDKSVIRLTDITLEMKSRKQSFASALFYLKGRLAGSIWPNEPEDRAIRLLPQQ